MIKTQHVVWIAALCLAGCSFNTEVSEPKTLADGSVVQSTLTERTNMVGIDSITTTDYRQEPGEPAMHAENGTRATDPGLVKYIGPPTARGVTDAAGDALLRPTRIYDNTNVRQSGAAPASITASGVGTGGTSIAAGGTSVAASRADPNVNSISASGSRSDSGSVSGSRSGSSSNSNSASNAGAKSGSNSNAEVEHNNFGD